MTIKLKNWRYVGHIVRNKKGRWGEKSYFGDHRRDKKKVGRPYTRWKDEIILGKRELYGIEKRGTEKNGTSKH